ncbi:hypothetical protein K3495_g4790 [Podosphaera aphanis]|nr:hypothetical protein K3495_g4790 [Podosphaera aphanis]
MESVPESRSMLDFRTPSVPTLRLKDSSFHLHNEFEASLRKPSSSSRSQMLTSSPPTSPALSTSANTHLCRNSASFSRGHLRSKSTISSTLAPPPIARAHSMPGFNSTGRVLTPQSPSGLRNSSRIRSPKKPVDEVFIGLPNRNLRGYSEKSTTDKDDQTPRVFDRSNSPISPNCPNSARIRRPASPRFSSSQINSHLMASPVTPATSSPTTYSPRSIDSGLGSSYCYSGCISYPGSLSSFSIPTTPTSARSRSPSISSLETIPDSPDAEEAALEAERLAQLKLAADATDHNSESKPMIINRSRSIGPGISRDKRKRWSVCGAERRSDLNLGTIWED